MSLFWTIYFAVVLAGLTLGGIMAFISWKYL